METNERSVCLLACLCACAFLSFIFICLYLHSMNVCSVAAFGNDDAGISRSFCLSSIQVVLTSIHLNCLLYLISAPVCFVLVSYGASLSAFVVYLFKPLSFLSLLKFMCMRPFYVMHSGRFLSVRVMLFPFFIHCYCSIILLTVDLLSQRTRIWTEVRIQTSIRKGRRI